MQLREWIMAFEPVVRAHSDWVKLGCATESSEPLGMAVRRFLEEWRDNGKPPLPPGVEQHLSLDEMTAAFAQCTRAWPPRYDQTPETAYAFWPFMDALLVSWASLRNPEPTPVETVAQLAAGMNPVPNEQIARIYGWTLPNGAPDVRKVRAEIEKPGSQTDGGRYLPPDQRATQNRRDGALQGARVECERRNAMLLSPREPVANVPDLAEQKVSVGQMAKMTGKSREEIRAMLELANITDYVEDYTLDVVDPRRSAAQNRYDAATMGVPLDRSPPGMPLDDEFSDDLLAQAAAAGMDDTPRIDADL
jgi:hypothetical protein